MPTEPTPRIRPGQTVANPVTGERFTFLETAASSGGELLEFDLALGAGGSVPFAHVHPVQTERFEMTAGEMTFRLGRRSVVAGPGEVVTVEPGVRHSFANRGTEDVRVRVAVSPALAMEEMFADVIEMAEAGRLTRGGMPRNPIHLARLARAYDHEAHAPFLGRHVQRALLAPLAGLGRLRRGPRRGPGRYGERSGSGLAASGATTGAEWTSPCLARVSTPVRVR